MVGVIAKPPLRSRHRFPPDSVLLCFEQPPGAATLDAVCERVRVGDSDLDSELLIVASPHEGAGRCLQRLRCQGVFWDLSRSSIESLSRALAQQLYQTDLFDHRRPVRGVQWFGRAKELPDLRRRIQQGERVAIFGLRKMGKTSLAQAALENLDPELLPLYRMRHADAHAHASRVTVLWQDIQSLPERTLSSLCSTLFERLRERLPNAALEVPGQPGAVPEQEDVTHSRSAGTGSGTAAPEVACHIGRRFRAVLEPSRGTGDALHRLGRV